MVLAAPLLLGADSAVVELTAATAAPSGLDFVTFDDHTLSCLASVKLADDEVVWPRCFDDPSKATALSKRLRKRGIKATVQRVGTYQRVVRYDPLSVNEAAAMGRDALSRRPDGEHGMLDVSVDWDPELASFVWDLDASCPDGWDYAGTFKLTAYVLAQEKHFSDDVSVPVCGLQGTYRESFIHGDGVRLQGSGLTLDGRVVHWRPDGCFEETRCAMTATSRCARTGRTIAVDPSVIPLGADVLIEGVGLRRAEDTGGGIEGNHIDVYYGTDLSVRSANTRTRHDKVVCVKPPEPAPGSTN